MLAFLQQNPIIVDVNKQPPPTPEISYGSVLLSGVELVAVILIASAIVGVIVGGLFIFFKKRNAASAPIDPDPGHALRM